MNKSASSIKKCCTPEFTKLFRWILYDTRLTWGAKCLALAVLDSPTEWQPKNAVLARKLASSPSQVSVWVKELKDNKMVLRQTLIKD